MMSEVVSGTPSPAAASAPPASAPAADLRNVQLTAETARAQIAALKKDGDFFNRLQQRDQAAHRQWSELHKAGYGSGGTAEQQAAVRNEESWNLYVGDMARRMPMSAADEAQMRGGTIPAAEYRFAKNEIARLKMDRGFFNKVMAKEADATARWTRLLAMVSLRPV